MRENVSTADGHSRCRLLSLNLRTRIIQVGNTSTVDLSILAAERAALRQVLRVISVLQWSMRPNNRSAQDRAALICIRGTPVSVHAISRIRCSRKVRDVRLPEALYVDHLELVPHDGKASVAVPVVCSTRGSSELTRSALLEA